MTGTTVATPAGSSIGARLGGLEYPFDGIPESLARMREAGFDVIDLGAGDPHLPVPEEAIEALCAAARDPRMQRYAFQRGLPELREAISDWMEHRYGRRPDPYREILPLIGSKEGLIQFALTVTEPGDLVLIPDPWFVAYTGATALGSARPHFVRLRRENGFLVPPDEIRRAPEGLRLVYLNYPNNPTGATADLAYLQEVVEACRERGAFLAYDNAYAEIVFDGYRAPGLLQVPGASDVAVEFHSFSKSFNMTGWRLGWACGSAKLIAALARNKMFVDTGVYLPIQAAGAATLRAAERYLPGNLAKLDERRSAAVAAFRGVGFEVEAPLATLYLWMPIPHAEPSLDFANRVLEQTGVFLLPGARLGDGGEGYVRVALSPDVDRYEVAARRVAQAM